MTGAELWEEIEDFLYDYYNGNNYCETYIDTKYSRKAIEKFLDEKIKEIKKGDK